MPLRQDRGALLFEGDATLLKRYLEDVEELTEVCGKTAERIKYAKYYCDPANEKVFHEVSLTAVTWEDFKSTIQEQYTVREEECPSLRSLDRKSVV